MVLRKRVLLWNDVLRGRILISLRQNSAKMRLNPSASSLLILGGLSPTSRHITPLFQNMFTNYTNIVGVIVEPLTALSMNEQVLQQTFHPWL